MLYAIGYELRKLCLRPFFLISLAVTLLVPLLLTQSMYGKKLGNYEEFRARDLARETAYDMYGGQLTLEKYTALYEAKQRVDENLDYYYNDQSGAAGEFGGSLIDDAALYSELYSKAEYINCYYENTGALTAQADEWLDTLRSVQSPDGYTIRANEAVVQRYSAERSLAVADSTASGSFFGYNTQGVQNNSFLYIYLLFIVVVCSTVFSGEHESGMYRILYTTRYGRGRIFTAKLAAVTVIGCSLAFLHNLFAITLFAVQYGFGDWNLSIQNTAIFQYCPFDLTVGQFIFILTALRALAYIFTAVICFAVSAWCKRSLVSLLTAGAVTAGLTVLALTARGYANNSYYEVSSIYVFDGFDIRLYELFSATKNIIPFYLLKPDCFFTQFDMVNVFGLPVDSIYVALFFKLLELLLLIAAGYLGYIGRKAYYRNKIAEVQNEAAYR